MQCCAARPRKAQRRLPGPAASHTPPCALEAFLLGFGSTASHTDHRALPFARYDSGMTSPFSQLCFRFIVHDIAAAMSRRPVCYHTFAKSLRFTRHHTQLPFEMQCVHLASRAPLLVWRRVYCPPDRGTYLLKPYCRGVVCVNR